MSNEREYNGWTNYETWVVKLWIDNDQGSQEYWLHAARQARKHNVTNPDAARYELQELLKDEHEEQSPEVVGVYADLLNASLCEVNWREIAKNLLTDLEDVDPDDEDDDDDDEA